MTTCIVDMVILSTSFVLLSPLASADHFADHQNSEQMRLPVMKLSDGRNDNLQGLREAFGSSTEETLLGPYTCHTNCSERHEKERNVLITLYNATNGDRWYENKYWNQPEVHQCNWGGICCTKECSVYQIDLRENNLNGRLPSEIGSLHNLTKIDVSGNQLSGEIPPEVANLKRLTHLYLDSNPLSGKLPIELGTMTNLEKLSLLGNNLSGELPTEIGNLEKLTELVFGGNKMSGPMPSEFGNLISLTVLRLHATNMSSTIPTTLGRLVKLKYLDLSENSLFGKIPLEVADLVNLALLSLKGNFLTGSIPNVFANLTGLRQLNLGSNSFTDKVPIEIGGLVGLNSLWLPENKLVSPIPVFSRKNHLIELNMSANALDGTLGTVANSWIDPLTKLEILDLSFNRIGGQIPTNMVELPKIEDIILSGNEISGTLPPGLGKIRRLKRLHLDQNKMKGELPEELGDATLLKELKLSNNIGETFNGIHSRIGKGFRGTIPVAYNELGRLEKLEVGSNNLTGTIHGQMGKVANLEILDLSNNLLGGKIPYELSLLSNIEALRLLDNIGLEQPAPLSVCGIASSDVANHTRFCPPEREILKLFFFATTGVQWANNSNWVHEYNDFCTLWHGVTCDKRDQATGLAQITGLNLPSNKLSGTIPTEIAQLTNLEMIKLDDNKLTGNIPSELGSLAKIHLKKLDLKKNSFSGTLPSELGLCNENSSLVLDLRNSEQFCPERAFIKDLYDATSGKNWSLKTWNSTDPSEGPCSPRWEGVSCDDNSSSVITTLDLAGNALRGSIPSSIESLKNLTSLLLQNNNITGTLPAEIGSLQYLKTVKLAGNKLIGSIPDSIWELKNLEVLDISDNSLTGRLPAMVGVGVSIKSLFLSGNRFSGTIPDEMACLSNLEELSLSFNGFSGSIPEAFAPNEKCANNPTTSLSLLHLCGNRKITGKPPGNLCDKQWFDLHDKVAWCPGNLYERRALVTMIVSGIVIALCWMLVCLKPQTTETSWIGQRMTAFHLNCYARVMVSLEVAVAAVGLYFSLFYEDSSTEVSVALSGLVGWHLGLLAWAATIPNVCKMGPFIVSVLLLPPASLLGLTRDYIGTFFLFCFFLYLAWSIPCFMLAFVLRLELQSESSCRLTTGGQVERNDADIGNSLCCVDDPTLDERHERVVIKAMAVLKRFTAGFLPVMFFSFRAAYYFIKASRREEGEESFHENQLKGWVSLFSGMVTLLTLISFEVERVAQLSIKDFVFRRVTFWEIVSMAANFILIIFALFLESVKQYRENLAIAVVCAIIIAPAVQLLSLRMVTLNVYLTQWNAHLTQRNADEPHPYVEDRKKEASKELTMFDEFQREVIVDRDHKFENALEDHHVFEDAIKELRAQIERRPTISTSSSSSPERPRRPSAA